MYSSYIGMSSVTKTTWMEGMCQTYIWIGVDATNDQFLCVFVVNPCLSDTETGQDFLEGLSKFKVLGSLRISYGADMSHTVGVDEDDGRRSKSISTLLYCASVEI